MGLIKNGNNYIELEGLFLNTYNCLLYNLRPDFNEKGILQNETMSFKSIITNYFLIIGGACYIAGFIFWLGVLNILPLSIAYPASSIAYIGVIIASSIFLSEPITLFKLIGISLICLGVFFYKQKLIFNVGKP